MKRSVDDLAVFGGEPVFDPPRSIGNLVDPDVEAFLRYSRIFVDAHRYSNNGPANRLLESRLAAFHDTERCVTFASAFWGLSIAMRCLALPGRSEVVMPSLTYRRMGEIAASAGLVPRFCEVDPDRLAQTAETTAPCITPDTALIVGVHPTVDCCDAWGLEELSKATGVPLLFDSVESVYETCRGRKVGTFGRAEGFSLHATKLVNGFEGGYLTTNDGQLADRLVYCRGFGFRDEDEIVELGINAKLNEIHAAAALAGLDDVEDQVHRNRARYEAYRRALAEVEGIDVRAFDESERCSFKNVLAELDGAWPLTRGDTLAVLHSEGALARPYYWPALHTVSAGFETRHGPLPVSEDLAERFVLLPCGHQVDGDDVDTVAGLLDFASRHAGEIAERLAAP